MEADDDEPLCRYCFEGTEEGELISPCKCSGGQKYVHLKCLRRWQRMVLVSQPTHPAFYDRDLRHQTCNVCKSEFTCAPPTRHELMASFTGPEIAALINAGSIIAAHKSFSNELERQLETMPPMMRRATSYRHWIKGVYLITAVEEEEARFELPCGDADHLDLIRKRLGPSLSLQESGKRLRLVAGGSLQGVSHDALGDAFAKLKVPCTLCLEPEDPPNCGDDHIVAVNLTRPLDRIPDSGERQVDEAFAAVAAKYKGAMNVKITHFRGGPCDEGKLLWCIVLGGGGCGWTIRKVLKDAIELAHTRAVKRCDEQGDIHGGQTIRLQGLKAAPELNGESGLALRFHKETGRWLVRLRNGEGKQVKPDNLEAQDGDSGRVFAVWGDARWSRAQLLGEIAKGDWGLCHANISDLVCSPCDRWSNTEGRLAFAPITEMSESYMREAQQEMVAAREAFQMQGGRENEEEEDMGYSVSMVSAMS
mmetsp:Transcript_12428/g.29271  ORF Transcript_12428/g.29271 Transcript_12428/m.29271 type:complete len:478 (+) Transcript_12428:136-1569(+)